jgi:hypothetical protein
MVAMIPTKGAARRNHRLLTIHLPVRRAAFATNSAAATAWISGPVVLTRTAQRLQRTNNGLMLFASW